MEQLYLHCGLLKVGMTHPIPSPTPHGFGCEHCGLPAEYHSHINIKIYEARLQLLPSTSKQQSHLPCHYWPYRDDLWMSREGPRGIFFFFLQSPDESSSERRSLVPDGLCRCEHNNTKKKELIPLKLSCLQPSKGKLTGRKQSRTSENW